MRSAVVIDCSADCVAGHCTLGRTALDLLAQSGVKHVHLSGRFASPTAASSLAATHVSIASGTLEAGPVFFDAIAGRVRIYRASRLVVDLTQVRDPSLPALTAQSFYYGVQRAENDAFTPVKAALTTDGSPTIALPSRLSGSGPLAGLRIAFKDIYAAKGASLVCSSLIDAVQGCR